VLLSYVLLSYMLLSYVLLSYVLLSYVLLSYIHCFHCKSCRPSMQLSISSMCAHRC